MKIEDINKWIKDYLEDNDVCGTKICKKSGISTTTLSHIKNNVSLARLDTLSLLAVGLGLEIDVQIKVKEKVEEKLKRYK